MEKNVTVVTGANWGDEGKGKVTHFLLQNATLCIRATGGNNAGHTVVDKNGVSHAFHLCPSSVLTDVVSLIGPGVVCDLRVLCEEIEMVQKHGYELSGKFFISDRATVIMPHHILLDQIYEDMKANKVGTTMRGIGPAYEEKTRRTSIRFVDLFLQEYELQQKIEESLMFVRIVMYGMFKDFDFERQVKEELKYCLKFGEMLKPYVTNAQAVISKYGNEIVIEGAQATYLDLDHGDFPMVTSSNPNASGSCSGAGVGPMDVCDVILVTKAYSSRVGEGPFLTELFDETGDLIRELGHEYGTTTKRPRRCGWFDAVMVREAVELNSATKLCINHIDTIGKLPEILVCTGYKKDNNVIDYVPTQKDGWLPVYTKFEGGFETEGCKTFDELPIEAKEYINFIEKFACVNVKYIGIGPDTTIIK